MSLLNDIKAEAHKPNGRCGVAILLQELTKADREDLEAAMADMTLTSTAIVRVLNNRGHNVKESALQRHRRKACSCDQ